MNVKDKDLYQLWWEYLKRSDRYRAFCQWWNNKEKELFPESLNEFYQSLWNIYMTFGNVYSESFEDWWQTELDCQLPSPIRPYYSEPGKCMIDYRKVIGKDISKIYRKFKKELGRIPNIEELIYNLELYMDYWENERAYLLVEYQHKSTVEISAEFHKFLKERKEKPSAKERSRYIKGVSTITTIRVKPDTTDSLRRYLRVYDYRQSGLKFSEIAKEMWETVNDDDDHSEDTERIVKRDLLKAKKIISNAERGYFPGEF